MRKLVLIFAIVLGAIVPASYAQVKQKVAVYMTGSDVKESYKKVIGSKLVSAITQTDDYAAVERTADFLAALSEETDYQTSGEVRDSQIAQLGQKFGVKYVVVADISELFDQLFMTSRMINVETGLVEKSFDLSGQAESLDQLMDLSSDLARGLLDGISAGNRKWSTSPVHLALCVTDANGKVYYLTTEQWQRVKENDRRTMSKNGVCVMENGDKFLVRLLGTEGNWYSACSAGAPSMARLQLMYSIKDQLNAALEAFGGNPMPAWEWSNESLNSSDGWGVNMSTGYMGGITKSFSNSDTHIRPVIAVPPSAI